MRTFGDSRWACSRRRPGEIPNAEQVVGCQPEEKHPADPSEPAVTRLTQQRYRLEPAEDLFDAFARTLAEGVAGMPRRARIDRAATLGGVLGQVRRDAERAQRIAPAASTTAASRSALAPADVSRPPTARP